MLIPKSAEDAEQEACRDGGANDAGHIRAHGVHEKVVALVVASADILRDTCGHRDSRDTGRTDQRIDLAARGVVHDDTAGKPADRGDGEGDQAEDDDLDGVEVQEVLRDHGGADTGGQEDGDDVHQRVLCRIGKPVRRAEAG